MRITQSRGLAVLLLLVPALAGLWRGDAQPAKSDDAITALIRQLGSDVFTKRQSASREILKLGEAALPALHKAVFESRDAETRARAEELIAQLTPKTRKSNSTGLELVLIDRGDYAMGSPETERHRRAEESQHRVSISKPFYIGKYEVTQEEYQKVMGKKPSWFSDTGEGRGKIDGMDTRPFPVEKVSWFDALEFCNQLSKKDDLPSYYELTEVTTENNGSIKSAKVAIRGGSGYRLPTEAEWEYSCRAGMPTPFHFGTGNTGIQANLRPSPGAGGYGGPPSWKPLDRTTKVGSYGANLWGLHDMHGNVAEWCWDYYDADYYANAPAKDPSGPKTGKHRVHRGGSWLISETASRSASRGFYAPEDPIYYVGFRVARNR